MQKEKKTSMLTADQKSSCVFSYMKQQKTLQKYQTSFMFASSVFVVAQLQMLKTHLLKVL